MNPPNHRVAGRQAADLLERRLRRLARATRKRHIQRAEQIAQVIWKRWQVGVYRWRLQHVKWYLTYIQRVLRPNVQYQHYLTITKLCKALSRTGWIALLFESRPKPVCTANISRSDDPSGEHRVGERGSSAYTDK